MSDEVSHHTGGHPSDSYPTEIKKKNDIKGIASEPRAKIADGRHLYLLCPVDATLCEAALAFPYNGRNQSITCKTCGQSYYIGMNHRMRGRKEALDDVVQAMNAPKELDENATGWTERLDLAVAEAAIPREEVA